MTMTDPADEVSRVCEGSAEAAVHGTPDTDAATDTKAKDEAALQRIAHLPRDVGWMMVSVGVLGVILPGIPGVPFLVAGAAVLAPGGPRLLERWARRRPRGVVHYGLKQIGRWHDDLERRYPRQLGVKRDRRAT
jgi:hypothetical protein